MQILLLSIEHDDYSTARPKFIEGVDRPQPLVHLINGGEDAYKMLSIQR